MSEQPTEKKGGGKKVLLIIFIVLLAGINAFQIWMSMEEKKKHETEITEKNTQIDSLRTEAAQLLADLEAAKAEAAQLGLDTAQLGAQIRELQTLNAELKRTKNIGWSKYNAIKGQIAGFKELLLKKDQEIAMKDSTINIQKANIDSLNVEKNALKADITNLTDERDNLQSKVDIASVLKAENIKITMVNEKGKEYEKEPFKAKKIDKLKITFNLAKNPVAETGTKPIAIRIVEPGGAALYDLATGGGSFTSKDGKEIFYSAKQEIMFANKSEKLNFMYSKGSLFKAGSHEVEVYEGENLIGKGIFNVK